MLRVAAITLCMGCSVLFAHEDPHDVIHSLTHRLEHAESADKADLYFKRAVEYRASGQKLKAQKDLLRYTALKPDDHVGWLELGRVEADGVARLGYLLRSLVLAESDHEKSMSNYGLAEHFYEGKAYSVALDYCEESILLGGEKALTPLLFKSHLLWRLGELGQRVEFLTKAKEGNQSIVLENAWVDAVIDAGQGDKVKDLIVKEMEGSRFKSSWLIRAARCEAEGSVKRKEYAQLAINEIQLRLNVKRPDVTLLMDLARAFMLLGEHDEAVHYLKHVRLQDFNPWAVAELEQEIKMSVAAPSE